jgi:hypothetical protein
MEISVLHSSDGAKVVVTDIDDRGGNEIVPLIKSQGGDAVFIRADTSTILLYCQIHLMKPRKILSRALPHWQIMHCRRSCRISTLVKFFKIFFCNWFLLHDRWWLYSSIKYFIPIKSKIVQ